MEVVAGRVLKIFVNRAAQRKPGPTEIGGVLHNHQGNMLTFLLNPLALETLMRLDFLQLGELFP